MSARPVRLCRTSRPVPPAIGSSSKSAQARQTAVDSIDTLVDGGHARAIAHKRRRRTNGCGRWSRAQGLSRPAGAPRAKMPSWMTSWCACSFSRRPAAATACPRFAIRSSPGAAAAVSCDRNESMDALGGAAVESARASIRLRRRRRSSLRRTAGRASWRWSC